MLLSLYAKCVEERLKVFITFPKRNVEMHKSFLSQMDTDKAEEVWGHRGQALRGRWEGPNEEIGAYHREGPPLSSLLCSLPGSRTMQGGAIYIPTLANQVH